MRTRKIFQKKIFEYFPDDHRDSNIAKVATDRSDLLQAYDAMMDSYYSMVPDAKAIRKKVEEIKNRGRYT